MVAAHIRVMSGDITCIHAQGRSPIPIASGAHGFKVPAQTYVLGNFYEGEQCMNAMRLSQQQMTTFPIVIRFSLTQTFHNEFRFWTMKTGAPNQVIIHFRIPVQSGAHCHPSVSTVPVFYALEHTSNRDPLTAYPLSRYPHSSSRRQKHSNVHYGFYYHTPLLSSSSATFMTTSQRISRLVLYDSAHSRCPHNHPPATHLSTLPLLYRTCSTWQPSPLTIHNSHFILLVTVPPTTRSIVVNNKG